MKKILIVEDETSLRKALVGKLSREGFSALEAVNGKEGLAIALKEHPDLILLDIIMPVMDGITMLEKLRTNQWGQEVPVVILTNLSDSKTLADALRYGSHDYLVKTNWQISEVVKLVKTKLKIK